MNKRRMISVTGIAMMLAMIFFACKEEVAVSGVKLDKTALTLTADETAEIKATVEPADATVKTVNWSIAPQGIVTLTDNGDGSCTLKAEEEGTAVVTAATVDGGKIAQSTVTVNYGFIENTAFITAVGTQCGWSVEEDGTVRLTPENRKIMAAVTSLDISGRNLTDLSGIEWFTGLTHLDCANNQLSELDVSANTALTYLSCYNNQLTELDITKLTALKEWYCGWQTSDGTAEQDLKLILTEDQYVLWKDGLENHLFNERVTVEVAGGTAAVSGVTLDQPKLWLAVGETVTLTATVEPANAKNKEVSWSIEPANGIAVLTDNEDGSCTITLEEEGTATVTVITADGGKTAQCGVENVDIFGNTSFVQAVGTQCGWTVEENGTVKLTPENLEKIRAVTELRISGKGLTDLSGIEWFTGLTYLDCANNQLSELDVSANTALKDLRCYNNQLTELDVSANTALKLLVCYDNQLISLDVSANTVLRELYCYNNQLPTLDVSANTSLWDLQCGMQTSDGTTVQTLTLTLNEHQKTGWENKWKSEYSNDQNVVLAP